MFRAAQPDGEQAEIVGRLCQTPIKLKRRLAQTAYNVIAPDGDFRITAAVPETTKQALGTSASTTHSRD